MENNIENTSKELVGIVTEALEAKKGMDIVVLDISKISIIADYFVIATGSNINQIKALSDEVYEKISQSSYEVKQIEGYEKANWILMDCKDVIVHIFDKESRDFYDLQRIWSDAKEIELTYFLK